MKRIAKKLVLPLIAMGGLLVLAGCGGPYYHDRYGYGYYDSGRYAPYGSGYDGYYDGYDRGYRGGGYGSFGFGYSSRGDRAYGYYRGY